MPVHLHCYNHNLLSHVNISIVYIGATIHYTDDGDHFIRSLRDEVSDIRRTPL
ncbi:hypothetical protein HanRHA438_Chr07g0290231 [Helianthus annuus]|uniref:Uncharacterized protein n=1 Tax=Helianthus annuus TaxID=4232 RepID=A0A9K3IHW7_HELAN|nr:hypothetical protein HanXRQr2_Chr07g0279601 [Helianthus annuus]KAJ0549105.1 hypothetical protein HanHA300_Chr07g0229771 [Helianthus annuus]KAJ0555353.1 hypothetical protein HanIR_Chr07g0301131 [Helianthus annuus]KAJ0562057.1 hypothetical protein HanHA89_Chr07g0246911 [Helianthus annuus]KAJ0803846.1 hypothetical protein HanLR1_Chr00c1633g0812161 [Helianthus annuus]